MASTRTSLIGLMVVVLAVAACSSGKDDGAADERGPDRMMADAATAMMTVESASFTIEQSGASIFIDDNDQFAFRSAEGRFASPASSEALITVDALGFTTQIGAIAIDGDLWLTNPLTGEWDEAPESFTFDPAALFDAGEGFPALLSEAVASAELVADSPDSDGADGLDRHHLRTTVAASRVSVLTGGLVTEESDVDLWIEADTDRVVEVRFELQDGDEVSVWRMTIGDYDAEVTITPPELDAEG